MKDLAVNKKALFDYDILEKFQAGLVLTGQEVKSVRSGHLSLKSSFVTFSRGLPLLTNAHISKYPFAGALPDYDPTQSRSLLLRKREIARLLEKSQEKGLTIVPLRVYSSNRFVKVEIALARGKQLYDKKDKIKQRDLDREIRRGED